MKRSSIRMLRLAAFCAIASVAIYGGASCSSTPGTTGTTGTGGAGGAAENKNIADVIYEAETNDEALEVLLAATPAANPAKVAVFDAPTDAAALPSTPIPTFSWSMKAGTGGARAPMPPTMTRLALGDFVARERREWPGREQLRPLLDLLGSERAASAHGAPLNGLGYFLVFTTKANDKLLRVFTAKTTYTPDAAAWAKLTSAGGSIAASVLTAIFDNNDVAADGGPFAGPAISFTVTP